jgi:ATP-dependent Clp protease ATP-binding subunit ClpC
MAFEDEYDDNLNDPIYKKGSSKTPALDQYSRDLTEMAIRGELDPIIGRDEEIERVSQVLSRRKKNNPVLIGDPGVGKSAIAEGLALRIVQRKVSRGLLNKRVLSLDLGSVVAGTKYRGQFEERIRAILEELRGNKNVIVFIDEIHTMVGAGGASGSLDAANMFKPALSRGEIQCIGATTINEYRQNIEKDGALERRFQKVQVDAPDLETTLLILNNVKQKYEEHHNVTYTDDAIVNCAKLTERYITDRNFPDKALDAMDEAGSRTQLTDVKVPEVIKTLEKNLETVQVDKKKSVAKQDYEAAAKYRDQERKIKISLDIEVKDWEKKMKERKKVVDGEKVAEVVSMMSGIPLKKVTQLENEKLISLEPDLKSKVIGQDHAIEKIAKAIRRNRMGLKDPNKPIGSFIFIGPTGVGKTQLAKELASIMFGDPDALIRVDMSEYMEKFEATKLIGAPPGYIGHEDGGQLTEKVRRKPYSIILFDEIEKAHPDIFNTMLQILDEGSITDGMGRKINFKNTLIILTSNVGQRNLQDYSGGMGFTTKSKQDKAEAENEILLKKELQKTFSPEFINRLDDIVYFKALEKEDVINILDVEISKIMPRLESLGYKVKVAQDLKEKIAENGFDPKFGARPIKRMLQKYVEDTLADLMVQGKIEDGSTVTLSYDSVKEADMQIPVKVKITAKKKPNQNDPDKH